jgi:ABC-type nitrate/sulfonate/bicarbonate transport system substrate-binding protein
MTKLITPELINERLEAKGFGEKQADGEDLMYKAVLGHYDHKLIDEWDDDADYFIYEESTADGYSVYIATANPRQINIGEDVYYYDSDLGEMLAEAIKWGNGDPEYPEKIYVDDLGAQYVQDAMEQLFEELSYRFEEEVIDELKEEGYEYEDEDED